MNDDKNPPPYNDRHDEVFDLEMRSRIRAEMEAEMRQDMEMQWLQ